MLTENDIVESVAEELKKIKYDIIKKATTREKGIDILARRGMVNIYIEAKGATSALETSKRFGQSFNKGQVKTHVSVALYKVAKMKQNYSKGENIFAIALPDNNIHKSVVEDIEETLELLNIQVIWVTEERKVKLTNKIL